MKQKPIIFSPSMVKAILEGRKTQTRRVIKPQPEVPIEHDKRIFILDGWLSYDSHNQPMCRWVKLPYQPGDVLWVRETWCTHADIADVFEKPLTPGYYYKANEANREWVNDCEIVKWRPSIHMPREAARIFLKVTNVRIERLQDIIEEDAKAEGMESEEYLDHYEWAVSVAPPGSVLPTLRSAFTELWDEINAKRGYGWETNPWVWVLEFSNLTFEGPECYFCGGQNEHLENCELGNLLREIDGEHDV